LAKKPLEEMTDYELIQAVVAGDNSYFAELIRRYKNLVYSVILRMVNNNEEVNDLAQEVFIKIYKNLNKYYPEYKFSPWGIRIATNHVIDYRRKKHQDTTPIDDLEYELHSDETPEAAYLKKERQRQLQQVMESLPDMYKIPIVLYHQQGLSYQEISEIIGEPLSKVKNRIFRGRKILKDGLTNMGGKGEGLYAV